MISLIDISLTSSLPKTHTLLEGKELMLMQFELN